MMLLLPTCEGTAKVLHIPPIMLMMEIKAKSIMPKDGLKSSSFSREDF